MTSTLGTTRPGACGDDSVVAAPLVLVAERLCRQRRPARRLARPRRRDGQRRRRADGGAARLRGDRDRPGTGAARPRPLAGGGRGPQRRAAAGRPLVTGVRGRVLRRGPVALRRRVLAGRRRRAAPCLQARRHDRAGRLDRGGFVGELLRTRGRHAPEDDPLALIGNGVASLELTEQTFTFRFESPECLVDSFRLWHAARRPESRASTAAPAPPLETVLCPRMRPNLPKEQDGNDRPSTPALSLPDPRSRSLSPTRPSTVGSSSLPGGAKPGGSLRPRST